MNLYEKAEKDINEMTLLETFNVQNMIQIDKVAPARWLKHSTNSSKATAIKKMEKSCNNATCLIKN
jgi:hypothetical protein